MKSPLNKVLLIALISASAVPVQGSAEIVCEQSIVPSVLLGGMTVIGATVAVYAKNLFDRITQQKVATEASLQESLAERSRLEVESAERQRQLTEENAQNQAEISRLREELRANSLREESLHHRLAEPLTGNFGAKIFPSGAFVGFELTDQHHVYSLAHLKSMIWNQLANIATTNKDLKTSLIGKNENCIQIHGKGKIFTSIAELPKKIGAINLVIVLSNSSNK